MHQRIWIPLGVAAALLAALVGGGAMVLTRSLSAQLAGIQPRMATAVRPGFPHGFEIERLEAFSGSDFNLLPDLPAYLDAWEASNQASSQPASPLSAFQPYLVFVNPACVQFQVHNIRSGDNFWKLAKQYGFTIDTIVGCNPQLEKIECHQGQQILLPSRGGVLHQVQEGETLDLIALQYGLAEEKILAANRVDLQAGILPGMRLFIPGGKPLGLSEGMRQQYSKRALFRSPLSGRYTSFVGQRVHPVLAVSKYHNGVDIACPMNSWVGASAEGSVAAAGWGGAVGKHVIINHTGGYRTMYGHLNAVYVRTGQNVKRGQLIGRSGATGRVTGPHLHYTIWLNGKVLNPLEYLW